MLEAIGCKLTNLCFPYCNFSVRAIRRLSESCCILIEIANHCFSCPNSSKQKFVCPIGMTGGTGFIKVVQIF